MSFVALARSEMLVYMRIDHGHENGDDRQHNNQLDQRESARQMGIPGH